MNQIAGCDWLLERARWSHLARSGLPAVSRMKNFPPKPYNKSFIDQVCSVMMVGYWPRSLFCEVMDLDFVSVHNHAKKELGQYPAILTSHLVNNPYKFREEATSAQAGIYAGPLSWSNWNFECFCGGRKTGEPGEKPSEHWWEASALATAPSLLP